MPLLESHASSDKHYLGNFDERQFNGFNMDHVIDLAGLAPKDSATMI